MKENCWEYKNCGRQPGGNKTDALGVCPVAISIEHNTLNDGVNGGRCCWTICGTLCEGKTQGTFASKLGNCMNCSFYNKVRVEEGSDYITSREILKFVTKKEK